jgi:hypothetical protein
MSQNKRQKNEMTTTEFKNKIYYKNSHKILTISLIVDFLLL